MWSFYSSSVKKGEGLLPACISSLFYFLDQFEYTLFYSDLNLFQTFSGNSDQTSIFANWLNDSVTTRHIRIELPQSRERPCLRLELYGCKKGIYPTCRLHSTVFLFIQDKTWYT